MSQEINTQNIDNPVQRLYEIIKQAKSKNEATAAKYVWADALGVDREDNVNLHLAIAEFIRLTNTAKTVVENLHDPNQKHYLEPFIVIEKILKDMNLESRWEIHKRQLNETMMLALEMAKNTISAKTTANHINSNDLHKIQKDVEELLENVISTNFESEELRTIVIASLEEIRRSILFYRINGSEGLRRAFDGTVGALYSRQKEIEKAINKDKSGATIVFKKVFEILANLSQIGSFGIQVAQLTGILPPVLGPGN